MRKSLVGKDDGPGELSEFIMTEDEMMWARNTMTPDDLADMLSGGLDLNHFLVMMVTIYLNLYFLFTVDMPFVPLFLKMRGFSNRATSCSRRSDSY